MMTATTIMMPQWSNNLCVGGRCLSERYDTNNILNELLLAAAADKVGCD